MKKLFLSLCCGILLFACDNKPKEAATTEPVVPAEPPQAEIGNAKFAEVGKLSLQSMTSGDLDTWMSAFADNARYYWSGGDSLVGKEAITAYWKERRANFIESISFKNDIWLPVKVNKSQRGPDVPGDWLFGWYNVTAKYKGAKAPISFWVHTDLHFDSNGKVDIAIQYLDRAPINAAVAKK